LKKAKLDVESIADAPSTSDTTPSSSAAQQGTEQRVAKASARLDDALQTVREETPTTPSAANREAEPNVAEPDKAGLNKDRNHQ